MKKVLSILMILFLTVATAMAQGKSISGVVLDATNHEPVIGGFRPGQGRTRSRCFHGHQREVYLEEREVRCRPRRVVHRLQEDEVPVGNQTELKIELSGEDNQLQGVVVTALGIKRSQKALSYNVQEIKNDALTTVKDANFMNSLNGKVAGVNIQRSASGVGGSTRVVMRGNKSISGDNNVLYVIDGVLSVTALTVVVTALASVQVVLRVKVSRISTLTISNPLAS